MEEKANRKVAKEAKGEDWTTKTTKGGEKRESGWKPQLQRAQNPACAGFIGEDRAPRRSALPQGFVFFVGAAYEHEQNNPGMALLLRRINPGG